MSVAALETMRDADRLMQGAKWQDALLQLERGLGELQNTLTAAGINS